MYKVVSLFLLFLTSFLFKAQNKRFIFEYRFAADSTHLEIQKKELLNLDIGKQGSKFYASEITEQDSLVKINEKPIGKFPYQGINFLNVIIKNYPDFSMDFYTSCSGYYKVNLNKKLDWQILPEKNKILGYSVQKATTVLYKRKWTVWFTTDIPVQDGPYFFHGLPGLIIKAEDEKKGISFNLVGIKKIKDHFDIDEIPYFFRLQKVEINESSLQKILKNYYDKPSPRRADENMDGTHTFHLEDKEVSAAEFYRVIEQRNKNALKKSNNLLRWDIIK
jgi:GLPGLI family protein